MTESRHAVIIRLHYSPDNPIIPWRFAFFRSMVLPRILNQTNRDFDLWIVCHPEHLNQIRDFDLNINICCTPEFPHNIGSVKKNFNDIMPHYEIQTSMDSDDLVSLMYIARIKEEVNKTPNEKIVISFQPYKLDLLTMKRYKMWERYGPIKCSMFHSLYQPDLKDYDSILNFDHSFISDYIKNIVTIPEGYCDMTIHNSNWMTALEPNLGAV